MERLSWSHWGMFTFTVGTALRQGLKNMAGHCDLLVNPTSGCHGTSHLHARQKAEPCMTHG